jgi:hypothetical protein
VAPHEFAAGVSLLPGVGKSRTMAYNGPANMVKTGSLTVRALVPYMWTRLSGAG